MKIPAKPLFLCLILLPLQLIAVEDDIQKTFFTTILEQDVRDKLLVSHNDLIQKGIKGFGTAEHAAEGYVEHGFNALAENKLSLAIQRFNEAWLLDENNSNAYLGHGLIKNINKEYCLASNAFRQAYKKGLNDAGFFADFGKVLTKCAIKKTPENQLDVVKESNAMYAKAHELALNEAYIAYIYMNQAESLYEQKKHTAAKKALAKGQALGGEIANDLKNAIEKH